MDKKTITEDQSIIAHLRDAIGVMKKFRGYLSKAKNKLLRIPNKIIIKRDNKKTVALDSSANPLCSNIVDTFQKIRIVLSSIERRISQNETVKDSDKSCRSDRKTAGLGTELIRSIKRTLSTVSTELSDNNENNQDSINLEPRIDLLELSIKSLEQSIQDLNTALGNRVESLQKLMDQIHYEYLPLTGGIILGEILMSGRTITQLGDPEENDAGGAVNVRFLKTSLDPFKTKLESLARRSELNSMRIAGMDFQFLKLTGNTMQGPINMNQFRIMGLPNPQQATEPVTLEYLKQMLDNTIDKKDDNNRQTGERAVQETNTIFIKSLDDSPVNSLPFDIISMGFKGFTWDAGFENSQGFFPWSNVVLDETSPTELSFELPSVNNNFQIVGKRPGVYILDFSMTVLIPMAANISYPSIQLLVEQDKNLWSTLNGKFIKNTTAVPVSFNPISQIFVESTAYNVVDISIANPHTNKPFILLPNNNQKIFFNLQNKNNRQNESCTLYVIQSNLAISWLKN